MQITNPPQQVPYITTRGGQKLQPVLLDMGTWDMNTSAYISVAHSMGAEWTNIRHASCVVISDSGSTMYPSPGMDDDVDPKLIGVCPVSWNSTTVTIRRRTGGWFDTAEYSSTASSRGWIILWVQV